MSRSHDCGTIISFLLSSMLLATPALANFSGQVVSILDGDTIEVLRNNRAVRIRLNGIDCPEKRQAFGTKAAQRTAELAFGKLVSVQTFGHDKYGRTIGDVFLPDGRMLNEELVREGLAWWYREYAPYNFKLAQLEAEAREAKRNLWSHKKPVPPWVYRHQSRLGARERSIIRETGLVPLSYFETKPRGNGLLWG